MRKIKQKQKKKLRKEQDAKQAAAREEGAFLPFKFSSVQDDHTLLTHTQAQSPDRLVGMASLILALDSGSRNWNNEGDANVRLGLTSSPAGAWKYGPLT